MRIRAGITAALAGAALVVAASPAGAVAAAPTASQAPAGGVKGSTGTVVRTVRGATTITSGCNLWFAGGMVATVVRIETRNGITGTATIRTENVSVPHRVWFKWDDLYSNGNEWRGVAGSIPVGGHADTWAAWGVYPPDVVFSIDMHTKDGRGDWNTCDVGSRRALAQVRAHAKA